MTTSNGSQGLTEDAKPLWKQPAALRGALAVLRLLQVLCAFAILVPAGMSADAARKAQSAASLLSSALDSVSTGLTRSSTATSSPSPSARGASSSATSGLTALGAAALGALGSPGSTFSPGTGSSSLFNPSTPSSTLYSSGPTGTSSSSSLTAPLTTSPSTTTTTSSSTGLGISSRPDVLVDPQDPLQPGEIGGDPTKLFSSNPGSLGTIGTTTTSTTDGFNWTSSSGPLSVLSQSAQNMITSAASNVEKLGAHRRRLMAAAEGLINHPQGLVGLYVIVLLLGLFTLALSLLWLLYTVKSDRRTSKGPRWGARCCGGRGRPFLWELIWDGLLVASWFALTVAAGALGLLSFEGAAAVLAAVLMVLLGCSFVARLLLVLASPAPAALAGEGQTGSPTATSVAADIQVVTSKGTPKADV